MKKYLFFLLLLFSKPCYSEDNKLNSELKLKVVNTFVQLGYYNPKECLDIINAIENRTKQCDQFGARFVRDAYANNAKELDTTDCKIIWKAILVTCRTNQDGFELMDIPTPWIKNSY